MSDRIKRLRLTEQECGKIWHDVGADDLIGSRTGMEALDVWNKLTSLQDATANAQLERVLQATVTCWVCGGKGEFASLSLTCSYCDSNGRVTLRTLLERDGGEK